MICTAITNHILTKKLLEEVDDFEENYFYSPGMAVAGAFTSLVIGTVYTL